MSLNQGIAHQKEHRKQYRGAKAVDPSCRNHGADDWSKSDRTIHAQRQTAAADAELKDFVTNGNNEDTS